MNNLTPIGGSHTSLFEKLKRLNMIESIPQNYVNPRPKGFYPVARCAYHFDVPRKCTEDCRTLKSEVEKMIQAKMIVVENDNPSNVTQNPLPAPNNVHFFEMICDKKECEHSLNSKEVMIEIGGVFTKVNVQQSD
ncbi:hypothetical protein RDI58_001002 [Solanum bulbocastanum]|uniref:Uncharacterized protein n=1 Tax=Solanum bulbocastanum TaxID=147425 RepID=A0AAN8YMT5_SOLBU